MAEFPAMPLWTDAYLADTRHLSDAEHGRYLLMLMDMWRSPSCRFPNDRAWLERRFRRTPEQFAAEIQPLLSEFCQCDGNWWTQKRLQKVWHDVQAKSGKQKGRAISRWEGGDRPRSNAATRSARMAEARRKGTHTKSEWEALKAVFGACVTCGTTEYPLEKDHVIPVYQGGSDGIENIQPSCARCNARKGPENIDRRMSARLNWIQEFAHAVGYMPLKLQELDACRTPATKTKTLKDSESLTFLPNLESVPSESEPSTVPSAKPKTRRPNEYPEAFQQFWLAYPKRSTDTKAGAFKAWEKSRKAGTDLGALHEGALRYAAFVDRTGCETAHVQTWINREGWTASYANTGNGHARQGHRKCAPSAEQEFWRRNGRPDLGLDPDVASD